MAKSDYVADDQPKLTEILRQAESRLGAQLTLAVAADQRAMTFAGIMAAIAAALVAYGTEKDFGLSLGLMIATLTVAAVFSAWAASPIVWDVYGTSPEDWVEDIAEGVDDLKSADAAMADFYADMIRDNDQRLGVNAKWLRFGLFSAIFTPIVGAVGALFA